MDPGDLHAPSQGKQADLGQKWLWIALGQLEGLNCCVFFCVLDGCLAPPLNFFYGTSVRVNLVFWVAMWLIYLSSNLLGDLALNPLK